MSVQVKKHTDAQLMRNYIDRIALAESRLDEGGFTDMLTWGGDRVGEMLRAPGEWIEQIRDWWNVTVGDVRQIVRIAEKLMQDRDKIATDAATGNPSGVRPEDAESEALNTAVRKAMPPANRFINKGGVASPFAILPALIIEFASRLWNEMPQLRTYALAVTSSWIVTLIVKTVPPLLASLGVPAWVLSWITGILATVTAGISIVATVAFICVLILAVVTILKTMSYGGIFKAITDVMDGVHVTRAEISRLNIEKGDLKRDIQTIDAELKRIGG